MRNQKNAAHAPVSTNQSLTVYTQGFAVVHESRRLRFCLGENQIQLEGMPQLYIPNSLHILSTDGDAEMTVTGISFEPATLNTANIMANLEGQEVELSFRSNSGRQRWTNATVVRYLSDKVLIRKQGGKTSLVNVADIVEVGFDAGAIDGLTNSNSIVLNADGTAAGGSNVKVLYKTGGMSWSAKHSAVYDEKAGVLTELQSWASIDNRSGAGFSDAALTLVAANLQVDVLDSIGYPQAAMAPMGGSAKRANVRSAQVEAVGEAKTYRVDGKFTISKTTASKQVPLGSWLNVPVKREYFVPALPFYGRANNEPSLEAVSIRLKIVNDAANNIGVPLPAGEVEIYQLDSSGNPQPTGGATLEHVSVGETFGFVYTKTDNIKAERKLVESVEGQEQPEPAQPESAQPESAQPESAQPEAEGRKFRDETWEVTVHNFNTDGAAVAVSVFEELQGKHDILNSTHDFKPERANRYFASIDVEAGKNATLRYSVRIWEE